MLPCFAEMKATPACTDLWRARYEEYLTKSRQIINLEKEEKSVKFQILYQNYKNVSTITLAVHVHTWLMEVACRSVALLKNTCSSCTYMAGG